MKLPEWIFEGLCIRYNVQKAPGRHQPAMTDSPNLSAEQKSKSKRDYEPSVKEFPSSIACNESVAFGNSGAMILFERG
jgi:hypothetical protein